MRPVCDFDVEIVWKGKRADRVLKGVAISWNSAKATHESRNPAQAKSRESWSGFSRMRLLFLGRGSV